MLFDRLRTLLRARLLADHPPTEWPPADWPADPLLAPDSTDDGEPTPPPPPAFDELARRHYAALELPPGADFSAVKEAYRRLIRQYHPDKYADDDARRQTAERVARQLNEAYQYFEQKFGKA